MHEFGRGIANKSIARQLQGFRNTTDRINKSHEDAKVGTAKRFFGTAERAFRFLGLKDAAENLAHYRSGTGAQKNFTDDQIAKHDRILGAIDTNRSNLLAVTFVGKTKNNNELNRRLGNLRDGQTYTFEDHFQHPIFGRTTKSKIANALTSPATYLAFGQGEVLSDGKFTATRKGNALTITGTVNHGFDTNDNRFDFNPGQPGSGPARILERRREAKPFRMQFSREQDVTARLVYGKNGDLTLINSSWGKIR